MRGRKIDSEFLSQFITECINDNKTSTDQIIDCAKTQINFIDQKIKEVEELRSKRSKLLGIVLTFEKPDNTNKINESKVLLFFKIQNPHICKFICDNMKESAIKLDSLYNRGYSIQDIVFCIKQLVEYKVISKVEDCLLRGKLFQEYLKFVLQDSQ